MVIQLNLLAHRLVSDIIRKMEPLSFKNACLASKCILEIADEYKKSIRLHLKELQVDITNDGTAADDTLQLYINGCGKIRGYIFESEKIPEALPDFTFFVFEDIVLYYQPDATILQGLCDKHTTCVRLRIEATSLVNENIRAFRPRELILTRDDGRQPSVEDELLKSINGLFIGIIEETHVINCLEEITPHMPTLVLEYYGGLPFTMLDDFLGGIKNNIMRITSGYPSFLNTYFKFTAQNKRSNKLLENIRQFQDIPHTVWKRTNYVILFYRIPKGSTLVLFLQERIERGIKMFCIAYAVLSDMEQFVKFFEDIFLMTNDEAVKELTCGRKRRRQFTELKKEYFGNK